jgi:hypothetical protein
MASTILTEAKTSVDDLRTLFQTPPGVNVHQPIGTSGVEVYAATELSVVSLLNLLSSCDWGSPFQGKQPIPAHSSSAVDIQASPSRSLEPSPTGNSWGQDDPFYSPESPWRSPRYGTSLVDDTASSLVRQSSSAAVSLYGDDDGAHLTSREEDPVARRRRTLRYSTSPSPLRKMGTAIKHVSQNLRRASVRVVNMASVGLERLSDDDDHLPDLAQTLPEPIRGRTLGFLGPTSRLRLLCFNFLVYPWTESIIFLLIIFNTIVLTIQSSRSLTLNDAATTVHGYFHDWEDYAVFVLSIVFTLEACARICVSGLFFDPDTTSSFALRKSLALPTGEKGLVGRAPPETIELPFCLGITQSATQTRRNAPYLRHSWARIDALAICGFWASFALASLGLEQRASSHIRFFRALSTLRTARLLTITSGTTAILQSLKVAQPLLTSVAYFVLFAMVLFSIIGVQVFKGSLRRTCVLEATLGEQPIVLDDQFCGGYVDPVFLNETGYINLAGVPSKDIKGYICPLGQTCRESGTNPLDGVESFDTIYFSALQVIIVASANGVRVTTCFFSFPLPYSSILRLTRYCTVVPSHVRDDRLGALCLVHLLHSLRGRAQLLAHQPLRRGHHQHLLRDLRRDEEERVWGDEVRIRRAQRR